MRIHRAEVTQHNREVLGMELDLKNRGCMTTRRRPEVSTSPPNTRRVAARGQCRTSCLCWSHTETELQIFRAATTPGQRHGLRSGQCFRASLVLARFKNESKRWVRESALAGSRLHLDATGQCRVEPKLGAVLGHWTRTSWKCPRGLKHNPWLRTDAGCGSNKIS